MWISRGVWYVMLPRSFFWRKISEGVFGNWSSILFSSQRHFFYDTPSIQKHAERRNQEQQPTFSSSRRREREFLIFFGKRALKFTPEARKPHTRTRNTDNKNVFRSFLLCWHQSRRQDERPRLCFLEKSVGASLRRKKTLVRVLVLNFFFVNLRFSSARAVESSAISPRFYSICRRNWMP